MRYYWCTVAISGKCWQVDVPYTGDLDMVYFADPILRAPQWYEETNSSPQVHLRALRACKKSAFRADFIGIDPHLQIKG